MKSTAEKTSTTTSTAAAQLADQPFFAKAGRGNFFSPATSAVAPAVQMKMAVNKPGDSFEQEADRMAGKVMRMPAPAPVKEEKLQRQADEKLRKKEEEKIQKAPEKDEKLQRKSGDGAPAVGAATQSAIQNKTTGGQPLSNDVRGYMEPRFNADFGSVRIHSDTDSAGLSNQLSARAFTYQNHIFFSRDQYQPGTSEGKQLLAHELTHTIQQGHTVQRSPQVTTTVTQPQIQRSAVSEILDWFADKANNIPGFRMFTVVLGLNPINMRTVDRSAANILRALIEFMPGGAFITTALDNHGVFNKVGTWVENQIKALGMVGQMFKDALTKFIDSLGISDLAPWNWGDVWNRAKRIFTEPIDRLISFAKNVVNDILKFVKDAILKPLAAMAQGTRGYDLLKAILGEDPITSEPVPRNADTLIGGFMKLIGQEEVWENIKKGKAVARAWAWFQGALAGLMGFVRAIPRKIIDTITSLTFQDIITVAGAFGKIIGAFVNIAGDFISWGLNQVLSLLEILFSVVAPGVMPYIKKAQAAFMTILKNPIGFVGNLVRAGRMGFEMFSGRFAEHLKAALIKWLVGPLAEAGVYIPKSFSLIEIVKLVLSVLGLTWQNIRAKLVKIIPEPVLAGLEKTAGILVTLVKDGPAAAWEEIKSELSELKDQLITQITQMISMEVVKAAVMKLVMMLNPAGAVVQAIIAIYKTITFFIEKINQIAAVVGSFIDSISAIAAGQVANAAKKVEQTLANTLTLVIAFLAKFAGLGGIPNKIVGIIKKIRQPIDKGLDKIVVWLGNMLKKAGTAVLQAGVPQDPNERLRLAIQHSRTVARGFGSSATRRLLEPALGAIQTRYGLTSLTITERSGKWWCRALINPGLEGDLGVTTEGQSLTAGELMTKVLSDLQQMGATRQNMQSLLTQLEARYKPMGLRSLKRVSVPGRAPVVRVAAGSTATIEGHRAVHGISLPDYGAVTAIVSIDGVPFNHSSLGNIPKGPHAEERIVQLLQVQIPRMAKVPRSVEILVSQSPCLHRCTVPITGLRTSFPSTSFSVYYKTLHASTSGVSTEESILAEQKIAAAGVHIYLWSGGGEIQSPDLTWIR